MECLRGVSYFSNYCACQSRELWGEKTGVCLNGKSNQLLKMFAEINKMVQPGASAWRPFPG